MNKMTMRIGALVASLVLAGNVFGQDPSTHLAFDQASNYGGNWQDNSNQGFGFGAWSITTDGNAGNFIAGSNPGDISGLGDASFGLFANATNDDFVNADRTFSSALQVGDTFSFLWGVNFDSDRDGGNKGFNLYTGGTTGTQLININQGNSQTITIEGDTMFSNYGTTAMPISMTLESSTSLRVSATGRDGIETFNQTYTISGAPDAFRFYASGLNAGDFTDQRQPYFDNLSIIPEPSSMLMMGLAGLAAGGLTLLKRRKRS